MTEMDWNSQTACRKILSKKRANAKVTESRTTGAIVPQSQWTNPRAWDCAKLNSFKCERESKRSLCMQRKAVRTLEVNEGLLVLPSSVEDLRRTITPGGWRKHLLWKEKPLLLLMFCPKKHSALFFDYHLQILCCKCGMAVCDGKRFVS